MKWNTERTTVRNQNRGTVFSNKFQRFHYFCLSFSWFIVKCSAMIKSLKGDAVEASNLLPLYQFLDVCGWSSLNIQLIMFPRYFNYIWKIWLTSYEKVPCYMSEQERLKSDCASAQSDHSHFFSDIQIMNSESSRLEDKIIFCLFWVEAQTDFNVTEQTSWGPFSCDVVI